MMRTLRQEFKESAIGRYDVLVFKVVDLQSMNDHARTMLWGETEVLSKMNQPSIIALTDYFLSAEKTKMMMVCEYAAGGDLEAVMQRRENRNGIKSEAVVLNYAVQIAMAFVYVHKKKVLHRDLKPSNIFLTGEGLIKLGDFGCSKIQSSTMDLGKTQVGTPLYQAPEVMAGLPYGSKADVFSFGVLLYVLVTGAYPFDAAYRRLRPKYRPHPSNDALAWAEAVQHADPDAGPLDASVASPALKVLILGLLAKDPSMRPEFVEVCMLPILEPYLVAFKAVVETTQRTLPYADQILDIKSGKRAFQNTNTAFLQRMGMHVRVEGKAAAAVAGLVPQ